MAVCLLVALGYDLLLLWLMPDGSESLSLLLWLIFVFRISRVIAEAFEPRKETE